MKKRIFSTKELKLLEDLTKTGKDLSEIFNVKYNTIYVWRKRLGIVCDSNINKGKKLGQRYVDYHDIKCYNCGIVFEVPQWKYNNNTKYCSLSCHKTSAEFKKCQENKDLSYITDEYRERRTNPNTSKYLRYKNKVHRLSEHTYRKNRNIINPSEHPRTRAGVKGGYQLDHIITVKQGFIDQIPAENIASLDNLRMLTWEENLKRNRK